MPEYPGGIQELNTFIEKNLKYPKKALRKRTEGKIILSFVIDEEGKVTWIQVINGVSKEIDLEAIRLIRSMPAWKPGTQNGRPVSVKLTLPLKFYIK